MIPAQGWPWCVRDLHEMTMKGLMCSSPLCWLLYSILIDETEDHPLHLMVAWLALADS